MAGKLRKRTKKEEQEALTRALTKAVNAQRVSVAKMPPATRMVVTVDVDPDHLVPYSVRWDGDRLLDQVQPDQAIVSITAGHHLLTWSFNHSLETTWRHRLTVKVDGQPARVLVEKNSTDNPDEAVSGGTEIFVA